MLNCQPNPSCLHSTASAYSTALSDCTRTREGETPWSVCSFHRRVQRANFRPWLVRLERVNVAPFPCLSAVLPSSLLLRSPMVSFLYERGWRQNFVWVGPGPDEEFEMAKEYLLPTMGGTIIDASCGSGLFSRRFAKSGLYSLVFALDYSENMLRQCADFNKEADILADESFVLVRADISRLPFLTSSVDAIHAGAALHSWPSPSTAVAEISRVLRPGGVFVATTFILDNFFLPTPVHRVLRQYIGQFFQYYSSERELEDLCTACGLVGFECQRRGQFIMLSATKPLH